MMRRPPRTPLLSPPHDKVAAGVGHRTLNHDVTFLHTDVFYYTDSTRNLNHRYLVFELFLQGT